MRPAARAWAVVAAAALLLVAPGAGARLSAHPGADTDVVVNFDTPGVIDVALTTSAEALRLKLVALSADTPLASSSRADDALLTIVRLRQTLLDRMTVSVDGVRLDPEWVGLSAPHDAEDLRRKKIVAHVRFHLPEGTDSVTWQTTVVFGSYMLIVQRPGQDPTIQWLQGPDTSTPLSAAAPEATSWLAQAATGVALGFTHIVPAGADHVLFVLGLFLLTPRLKPLLLQVTLFTVAHSATLALSTLGAIAVPGDVVEPLIALSIVYVAVENLRRGELGPSRLALVFGFGLLHGMGFAGALAATALPQASLVTTLVTFNVGVELGQLAVLVAATLVVRAIALEPAAYQRFVLRPGSVFIASMGAFWLVGRL